MCNNSPTEMDMLEGLDGWVCITTKEELEKCVKMSYDEMLDYIKEDNPSFNKEEYQDYYLDLGSLLKSAEAAGIPFIRQ